MRRSVVPAPSSAPARTRRNPTRSPSGPASGERSAPSSAAVPATRPIADARLPWPAFTSATRRGRYGRLIWLARIETPKIAKIRRTALSVHHPGDGAAGQADRAPRGDHGRPDVARADEQEHERGDGEGGAEPEDGNERQAESVDHEGAEHGTDGEAERIARPEESGHGAHPVARRDVPQRRQHDARCCPAGAPRGAG